ncbi:MAG: tetratricopeptide repeat protein [Nitrospinales bacterium]
MKKQFFMFCILSIFLACPAGVFGTGNATIKEYKRVITENPNRPAAYLLLGTAYADRGDYHQAVSAFQRAIDQDPQSAEAHKKLGDAYCNMGLSEEAFSEYEEALRLDPNYADAHFSFGLAYSLTQQSRKAVEEYKETLRIDPNYVIAHYNLGVSYRKLGHNQEAIAEYLQALRIDPNYADAHLGLGVVYGNMGRNQAAVEEFKKAVKLKPDYATAHLGLGLGYNLIHDGRNAIIHTLRAKALYEQQTAVPGKFRNRKTKGLAEARKSLREYYRKYGYRPQDFSNLEFAAVPQEPDFHNRRLTPLLKNKLPQIVGTGFSLGASGYIVTNYHVVKEAKQIRVTFLDGDTVSAGIAVKDPQNDVAFLKPARLPKLAVRNITFGDSGKMKVGQKVFTLGFPLSNILGRQPKYSEGVINALSGVGDDPKAFQISVPIQSGNSGGPLFNEKGEVVGLVSSSLDSANTAQIFSNPPQNVNFAIKSAFIKNLVPLLPEILITPTGIIPKPTDTDNPRLAFIEKVRNNIVLVEAIN